MYSIVYVLTDTEKLTYYYDLLISVFSLRKRNFKGDIYVLMDQDTRDVLQRLNRNELEEFHAQPIVVDISKDYSKAIKSRYLKTTMRKWVKGDFLYIDTDTIIAEELPEFISDYDIAQAPDVNCAFGDMSTRVQNYHIKLFKRCGYDLWKDDLLYFNSGVIWAKDTELTHKVFEGWHKKWYGYMKKKGVLEDQPALNQTNREMGGVIHHLSDLYNVQVSGDPFPTNYLSDAKIIHYIHNDRESTYMLSTKTIDKSDLMDPLIQKIIESPKTAFNPGSMLRKNVGREKLMLSNLYSVLNRMHTGYPKLFSCTERVSVIILNLWRYIHIGLVRVKKLFQSGKSGN